MAAIVLVNETTFSGDDLSVAHGARLRELLTSYNIDGGGSILDVNVYAKYAPWLVSPAVILGESPTSPGANYFSYTITLATFPGAWYPMLFTGNLSSQNGLCWFRLTAAPPVPGGLRTIEFRYNYFTLADFNSYPDTSLQPLNKLLRNEKTNTTPLSNASPSAYDKAKYQRAAFWLNKFGEWTNKITHRLDGITLSQSLRFYDSGVNAGPKEHCGQHVFQFTRSGVPVKQLNCAVDTLLTLQLSDVANAVPAPSCNILIARVDTSNPTVFWPNAVSAKIAALPAAAVDFADWGIGNTSPQTFDTPSTAPAPTAIPNQYAATVTIIAASLVPGAVYRFVAQWNVSDGTDLTGYSFISDPVSATCCLELSDEIAPIPTLQFFDFNDIFADYIIAAARQRIRCFIQWDATDYNAARDNDFGTGLCGLKITIYTIVGNLKHVLRESVYTKGALGTFNVPADGSLAIDTTTGEVTFFFNVGFETQTPNLYTVNLTTGAVLPPLSNQSWIGQTVYIEYQFSVCQPNGQDVINLTGIVEGRENISEGLIQWTTPGGAMIYSFCDSDLLGNFSVIMPAAIDDAPLITFLDKPFYSVANQRENESFVPTYLPQLTTPEIISQDAAFTATQANGVLNPSLLDLDTDYILCVLTKQEPQLFCGGGVPAFGGASPTPVVSTILLGESVGPVIVVFQTYGFLQPGGLYPPFTPPNIANCAGTDGIRVVWDSFDQVSVNNTICTGSIPAGWPPIDPWHQNDGVISFDKNDPLIQTMLVEVKSFASTGPTQWWYKVFCPGGFNQCNRSYLQDLNTIRKQPSATNYLGEEGFVFPWDGTEDATIRYNIPVQTSAGQNVIYQFSLYYNDLLADRTGTPGAQFVNGTGILTLPSASYVPGIDYFVLIVTLGTLISQPTPPILTRWRFRVSCGNAEPLGPTSGCINEYFYPLPSNIQDTGSTLQCFPLPLRKRCELELVPCEFLWNGNLCDGDFEFYQPICAPALACVQPEGTAVFEFEIITMEFPVENIAMVFSGVSFNCGTITAPQLASPFQVGGPAILSIQDFIDAFIATFVGNAAIGTAEQFGTGSVRIFFQRTYFEDNFGIDVCELFIKFCGAELVDDVVVFTRDSFRILAPAQASCCETPEPELCPPATKGACSTPDILHFQFTFPDKLNDWLTPGSQHFGWFNEDPINWLVRIQLTDGCCNVIDAAPTTPRWLTCSDVFYEGNVSRQSLTIDTQLLPDQFGFQIILNESECPKTLQTEPYRKLPANFNACDDDYATVLMEGEYSEYDCNNKFYGEADCPYRNTYRVPGRFRFERVSIVKEFANRRQLTMEKIELWRLTTPMLPPYAAQRVFDILAAERIYIDGQEYKFTGDSSRNIDFGNMWQIDVELEKTPSCKIDSKCV